MLLSKNNINYEYSYQTLFSIILGRRIVQRIL